MVLFLRYQLALVGGFLAMSAHVFLTGSRGAWFTLPHIGNAISAGLMFGHIVALMVFVARDLPLLLHDRWSGWLIRLLSIVGGIAFGALAWWVHLTLSLYQTSVNGFIVLLGGIGLSSGFILAPMIRLNNRYLRITLLIFVTATATFLPICFSYQNYLATYNTPSPAQALLYFQVDNPEYVWLIGVSFALAVAFFGQLPMLFEPNSSHRVGQ
jgi:hypothetical protein